MMCCKVRLLSHVNFRERYMAAGLCAHLQLMLTSIYGKMLGLEQQQPCVLFCSVTLAALTGPSPLGVSASSFFQQC